MMRLLPALVSALLPLTASVAEFIGTAGLSVIDVAMGSTGISVSQFFATWEPPMRCV